MKIVKFLGGLGNQMFQYAFFCALQQKFRNVKADLSEFSSYPLHNGYELERVFGLQLPRATRFERKLFDQQDRAWIQRKLRRLYGTKNAYHEEKVLFGYDGSVFEDPKHRYYWGYWQHIDYIKPVANQLRVDFRFPAFTDQQNATIAATLAAKNAISVHVRRGDYLGDPALGGICDEAYYNRALAYAQQQLSEPLFVFFSNDISWCREVFRLKNVLFVDWNTNTESFRDMQLMSLCKHHIIANSSFSWWGAWLNDSPSKLVVSPACWINMEELDVSGIILPDFVTL